LVKKLNEKNLRIECRNLFRHLGLDLSLNLPEKGNTERRERGRVEVR